MNGIKNSFYQNLTTLEHRTPFTADDFLRAYDQGYKNGLIKGIQESGKFQRDVIKTMYDKDLAFVQKITAEFVPFLYKQTDIKSITAHLRILKFKIFEVLYVINTKHLIEDYKKIYKSLDNYYERYTKNERDIDIKASFLSSNNIDEDFLFTDGFLWKLKQDYVKTIGTRRT